MRKDKVWKQVLALVLSAALVVGNGTSVSAATGDPAADNGAGAVAEGTIGSTREVTNQDAYKKLTFDFEDGEESVSGDDGIYTENGIKFVNQCSVPVVTDDDGNPIASEENPNMSEGVEIVDMSSIPDATDEDVEHGKALKFDRGVLGVGTTGIDYLTSVNGALAGYDYSNGVTFSFDIRPEAQIDWSYLFAFGEFYENNLTGTIGFIAGYEKPWTPFFPGDGWVEGNNVNSNYAYFADEANAHKWYKMTYIFSEDGMSISVDGVPAVAYKDRAGNMGRILENMSKGQLRLGKGIVPTLEGFLGYMDNVSIQPVHPGDHVYEETPVKEVKPTCTDDGYAIYKCTMCELLATIDQPALGHDYSDVVAAKDPTCTEKGNIEHYTCKREKCNGYFVSGDDGVKQIAKSKVELAAKGHTYGSATVTTKATPDKDGIMTSVCSACTAETTGHTKTEVINKVSNITLAGNSFAYTGKAITPAVTVKDSKGVAIAASNYTVTYANNNKVGTATATITFKGDKYAGSVNRNFTITEAANLSLDKSNVTLYTGKASKTATVKATVAGANKAVTWKSSNDKIAKVDNNGKITAVKAGKATITATANGISKSVNVTVKNPTITVKKGKKSVKKVDVKRKKSVKLTVSVSPKNSGITIGKLSKKQKKIATITFKKGKLTIKGKKKGTVKVKITSGKGSKTITVKVK